MQKILICSDKFKGSLTSNEVNQAILQGIKQARHPALCDLVTVSDGGDGFLSCINDLQPLQFETFNALHQRIIVNVGYKESTIYIEVASVIGIAMLEDTQSSIWERSSFGLGHLIYTVLDSSLEIHKIILGCGGSATNDAGYGLLCGLGAQFLSSDEQVLKPSLSNLSKVVKVDLKNLHPKLQNIAIEIIADVKGKLLGEHGCTQLFALQKGALSTELPQIEQAITKLQQILLKQYSIDINDCEYGLCCGGLTSILGLFPNTKYFDGASWIIKKSNLELKIVYCDMVISGEGKIDASTMHGKLIQQIAKLCKKHQKPLVLIAGQIDGELNELYSQGATCAFSITTQHNADNTSLRNSDKKITEQIKNLLNFAALI